MSDPYLGGDFYMSLALFSDYDFPYHYTNSGNRLYYWDNTGTNSNPSFVVNNNETLAFTGFSEIIFSSPYVEKFTGGVRFWVSSQEYTECLGITPTGTAPTINNGQCDYRNAAQYNGWGWNPVTGESCAPLVNDTKACDYSNATKYNGWGWNSVLEQSCPPLNKPTAKPCLDPDGDGWGWDGAKSCRP